MSIRINGIKVAGNGKGVPKGGSIGQILAKNSATDYDTKWIDPPEGGSTEQPSGITEQQVDSKISAAINGLIDGAPAAYDTLKDRSDYIASDNSAFEAMQLAIGDKVDKTTTVNGKPLSGNISLNASDVGALPSTTTIPTTTSQLTNDSDFVTSGELGTYITSAQLQEAIQAAILESWEASY